MVTCRLACQNTIMATRPLHRCGVLVALLLGVAAHSAMSQSPDPQWATINVFHINPAQYGAAPINMNTGDVRGDMYCEL